MPELEVNDLSSEDFFLQVAAGPFDLADMVPDQHVIHGASDVAFRFTEMPDGRR